MYFISKKGAVAKLFFTLSFTGLVIYTILAFYTIHTALTSGSKLISIPERMKRIYTNHYFSEDIETKYILIWTLNSSNVNPFGEGVDPFFLAECSIKNCFITTNKKLLNGDYTLFHAVIFNNNNQRILRSFNLTKRSPHQKYVYHSMQPSQTYPICSVKTENFYNWTWTYRLKSDITTPFIHVKDKKGNIVAPNSQIKWYSDVAVVNEGVPLLKETSKSVSWVIDNCYGTPRSIITYVKRLKAALAVNNLSLDIYGCGFHDCPKEGCLNVIEKYNFYLAHEMSLSEDYVSKEVLKAYDHHAVPIVRGGADYRKFLPEGSYINAFNMTIETLASVIDYTLRNPDVYNNYFAWKNYYTIEEYDIKKGLCTLCSHLHDKNKYSTHTSYDNFRTWWYDGPLKDKCLPKGSESFADMLSNLKVH